MHRYKLFIFDLDDTLFDYKATEKNAVAEACKSVGIQFTDLIYREYKRANDKAKKFIPEYIDCLEHFRQARACYFLEMQGISLDYMPVFIDTYMEASKKGVLISGIEETLLLLDPVRKVIGTNGTTTPRKDKLMNSSIAKYFEKFYSSELLGVSKPSREFFEKIANDNGVKVGECLYIGDNWCVDIEGAVNAGMDACFINSHNDERIVFIKESKVLKIKTISKLVEVLDEKNNRL